MDSEIDEVDNFIVDNDATILEEEKPTAEEEEDTIQTKNTEMEKHTEMDDWEKERTSYITEINRLQEIINNTKKTPPKKKKSTPSKRQKTKKAEAERLALLSQMVDPRAMVYEDPLLTQQRLMTDQRRFPYQDYYIQEPLRTRPRILYK
jgi:hypothetical protein